MNGQVTVLLSRLATDLSPTGLVPQIGVVDLSTGEWIAGTPSELTEGFGDSGFVLTLPGSQKMLPGDHGDALDMREIVDGVSEWAMDELGRGWPELLDDEGVFVALLQPAWENDQLVWKGGGTSVAVGELSTVKVA